MGIDKAPKRPPEIVIAASNSSARSKRSADYVCDGIEDDIEIQTAINQLSTLGGKLILLEGTFNIRNQIYPCSNINIELYGTLKLVDTIDTTLTSNITSVTNTLNVTDASEFNIGDYLVIFDDNSTAQGGGTGQTRKTAECVKITNITGNVITVSVNLQRTYTQAANAKVSILNSVFLLESVHDVTIEGYGLGVIDGNKSNQTDCEPVTPGAAGEDVKSGCGITSIGTSDVYNKNINIRNLKIKDSTLHNIAFRYTNYSNIEKNTCDAAHDKNILVFQSNYININNNQCVNAVFEDGIILYTTTTNININNNICDNNNRAAVWIGATCHKTSLRNNYLSNSKISSALNILGSYITCDSDTISEGCTNNYLVTVGGNNVNFNGVKIFNSNAGYGGLFLYGSNFASFGGVINTNTGSTGLSRGIVFGNSGAIYPANAMILATTITGCKTGVVAVTGITQCNIINSIFSSNTANISSPTAELITTDCIGL